MKFKREKIESEFKRKSLEITMNTPKMIFDGDREAYIENHSGIALYTKELIIIKTPCGNISFSGSELMIDVIRISDVFISGVFKEVKFDFIGEIKNVK